MKTIPMNDELTKASERGLQEHHEKFVQQGIDRWHRQREAKEQRDIEASAAETPRRVESGDN